MTAGAALAAVPKVTEEHKGPVIQPDFDAIPVDLKPLPGWVVWRSEPRPGQEKPAKVPYNPATGARADPSRPETGGSFDAAKAAYEPGGYDGVGLILHEGLGLVGLDLDKCRSPEAEAIEPWAQGIVDKLNSYTEVSPSDTGLRIFVMGKKPGPKCRRGPVEMYTSGRYLTVTGHGVPNAIIEEVLLVASGREKELAEIYREHLGGGEEGSTARADAAGPGNDLTVEEAVTLCMRSEKFARLWEGDLPDFPSRSEAEQSMLNSLAYATGGDPEKMLAAFRECGLWVEKCERTVPRYSIPNAIAGRQGSFYLSASDMFNVVEMESFPAGSTGKQKAPCQRVIALKVIEGFGPGNLLHNGQTFWEWSENGVWIRRDDREIKQAVHEELAKVWKVTRSTVDGVTDVAKTEAFRPVLLNQTQDFVNTPVAELHWTGEKWETRPHEREHYSISQIPVAYDPAAPAERFDRFLDEIFDGDPDADQKRLLLLELIGYSCVPSAVFERFALLVGQGANGKSIVLHVVKAVLGAVNCCAVAPNQFSNRFQRAHLHGKLANIVTELAEGSTIADAELKAIVSGEMMTAEHKMQKPFDFMPTCTVWLATNHMPHTRDFSDALFRRASVLTFNRTFRPEEQDKHLKERLEGELPGILTRALDAFAGVLRRGDFTMPPSVITAREAWRLEADQVATFIEDCVEREPGAWHPSSLVYSRYRAWATEAGINKMLGRKSLTQRMERHGFPPSKGSGGKRGICGLRLPGWINGETAEQA